MAKISPGKVNLDDSNSIDFDGSTRIELNLALNSELQNSINVIDSDSSSNNSNSSESSNNSDYPIVNYDNSDNGNPKYGVSEVITLLHSLPEINSDTVLTTAIRTIESFGIEIDSIIDDAVIKEDLTYERLTVLKQEIAHYSKEIMAREEEVDLLEVGLTEVVRAREYLERGMSIISSDKMKSSDAKKIDIENVEAQKTREITMLVLNNPVDVKQKKPGTAKTKISKRKTNKN